MGKTKISIIIPVYNVEQYLQECLDSVRSQTLNDIEIICIDDASSDRSAEIIRKYCEMDSRIHADFFSVQSSALSARKQGVLMASGEYLLFLDSDDYLEPDACLSLYEKITEEQVEILHFNSKIENCANLPISRIQMNEALLKPYPKRLLGTEVFSQCFVGNQYGFTLWNKLFSTELCKRAFLHMEDRYMPKAQDMYSYYIISFFAVSYYGWESKPFHHYCFGRGVTGSNKVNIGVFKRYCLQSEVARALYRFTTEQHMKVNVLEIVKGFEKRWIAECIEMWYKRLDTEDLNLATSILLSSWNAIDLVEQLANTHWYEREVVAQKIQKLPKNTIKQKEIKTIAFYYYHFTIGGVQRVLSTLIALFFNMGYKVILITDKAETSNDISCDITVERELIFDYQNVNKGNYICRLNRWKELIDKYNIDLVLYNAWTSPLLLWDMLFLKLNHISVIVQTHSIFTYSLTSLNRDFAVLPKVIALCDGVVVLSHADKAFWELFNNNVHYIPNPIYTELIRTGEITKGDQQIIVWVGRFSNEKQPWAALNIMEHVVSQKPNAVLYMIGDSPDKKVLEKHKTLAVRKGIERNIKFLGFQNDINQFLRQASINLVTSVYEGFSMVLVEAQAHGVPTVMYEMPYLEMAKPRCGVIGVEANNHVSAANKIIEILDNKNEWKRLSCLAHENYEQLRKYDYRAAWLAVFKREHQDLATHSQTKIMMDTILKHYLIGWKRNHQSITELKNSSVPTDKRSNWFTMKLKGGIRCYREHGMSYTLGRVKEKLLRLFGKR